MAAVKLGDYKSVLNLKANPANLGKKLKIHGIVEKYCGVGGVVKIDKVLLDGQEVQLPGVADVEIDPAKEYTPSEIAALAAQLQAGKTSSVEATIVGYVSEITEPYGEEYKNITFHMSDTKGGENQFYIYRAKGGDVASVAVGSKVKVVAKIQNFRGNTPETSGTVTVTILE